MPRGDEPDLRTALGSLGRSVSDTARALLRWRWPRRARAGTTTGGAAAPSEGRGAQSARPEGWPEPSGPPQHWLDLVAAHGPVTWQDGFASVTPDPEWEHPAGGKPPADPGPGDTSGLLPPRAGERLTPRGGAQPIALRRPRLMSVDEPVHVVRGQADSAAASLRTSPPPSRTHRPVTSVEGPSEAPSRLAAGRGGRSSADGTRPSGPERPRAESTVEHQPAPPHPGSAAAPVPVGSPTVVRAQAPSVARTTSPSHTPTPVPAARPPVDRWPSLPPTEFRRALDATRSRVAPEQVAGPNGSDRAGWVESQPFHGITESVGVPTLATSVPPAWSSDRWPDLPEEPEPVDAASGLLGRLWAGLDRGDPLAMQQRRS